MNPFSIHAETEKRQLGVVSMLSWTNEHLDGKNGILFIFNLCVYVSLSITYILMCSVFVLKAYWILVTSWMMLDMILISLPSFFYHLNNELVESYRYGP